MIRKYWPLPILFLIILGSFLLRVWPVYSQVFLPDGSVIFTTNDAWWHMRIIDNLVANFPHLNQVDPYQSLTTGELMDRVHLLDWLVAGVAWVLGLGHPSQSIVDAVAAFTPPVMGALVSIPVYVIGSRLFARWAGLLAAVVAVILPGEFLGRSTLGSIDAHVAESLLLTLTMCLLIMSSQSITRDDGQQSKTNVLALLAGIAYGCYIITWVGALGMGFLIACIIVLEMIVCHVQGRSTATIAGIGTSFFLPAAVVSVLFSLSTTNVLALVAAAVSPLFLYYLSTAMKRHNTDVIFYPAAVATLAVLGVVVASTFAPTAFSAALSNFSQLVPSKFVMVSEMQPLFVPYGEFTWTLAWNNYRIALWASAVGLLYVAWRSLTRRDPAVRLFTAWSMLLLVAVIAQRRYGYYFTINVALLSSCATWMVYTKLSRWLRPVKRRRKASLIPVPVSVPSLVLTGLLAGFLALPCVSPSVGMVAGNTFSVSVGWQESLKWLKNNSPEPFGSDSFYYSRYTKPPVGTPYSFPDSAYAVTAWTDYGYWITRIAHRIPTDNPGHLPLPSRALYDLLMSTDDATARTLEDALRSAYIVMDYQTVLPKFTSILMYYGVNPSPYTGIFSVADSSGGPPKNVRLFFPSYYKTLGARLFFNDGKTVVPKTDESLVVSLKGSTVDGAWRFPSYEAAVSFMKSRPGTMIAGNNPVVSPVPLPSVANHELVYSYRGENISEAVKVFKIKR